MLERTVAEAALTRYRSYMDLLSEILRFSKMSGTLYFRTSFTAPWGVEVPQYQNVSRFHYVHRGRCFAHLPTAGETVQINQGDLIIITKGASHVLSEPADARSKSLDSVLEDSGFTGRGALIYGESDSDHETQLICGHFAFDPVAEHVLIDALPEYILLRAYGEASPTWLNESLKMIGFEVGRDDLGSDLIAHKLAEIIFAQAIRTYISGDGKNRHITAAFADQKIRSALEAMHRDPGDMWTVDSLAKVAGLSRTSFANKFSELMGSTPLAYLTDWRMQVAKHLLAETNKPIIEVAQLSGYSSEASFGRVFKRYFDQPPASFRLSQHQISS